MKNNLLYFSLTLIGAGIGSLITWQVSKKHYESISDKEAESVKKEMKKYYDKKIDKQIDSLKEYYPDIQDHIEKIKEQSTKVKEETESKLEDAKKDILKGKEKYENIVQDYTSFSREKVKNVNQPYVISPDEVGEIDDYELRTYYYYADGYLADEDDEVVDDAEETIGYEALEHFGEYEEDSVYVRNEELKIEFEILLDERNYVGDIIDIIEK